ncbi:MAG: hypothetical protein AAF430_16860 [Myxococcota bacterium]
MWVRLWALLACLFLGAFPSWALSVKSEGRWLGYDPQTKTCLLEVHRPGDGEAASRLRKGEHAAFRLDVSGAVLTRAVVSMHGQRALLPQIGQGARVHVYWRPSEAADVVGRVRRIEVIQTQPAWQRGAGRQGAR